jgi:hypothetical protein
MSNVLKKTETMLEKIAEMISVLTAHMEKAQAVPWKRPVTE